MNIIGKWKYAEMMGLTDGTPEWIPIEDYVQQHPDPMFEMMLHEVIEFKQDGNMVTSVPKKDLPDGLEEEFGEDISACEGDDFILESIPWKEENGKFYMKDENPGTVFDEAAPEWIELPVENGKILLLGMSYLKKAEE